MPESPHPLVYLNGEILPQPQAHIAIDDRGFMLADGVYEVMRVYNGRMFRLDWHMERLARSAALLQLTLNPPTPELVGSSRVDLQACKLEYSIVSPK